MAGGPSGPNRRLVAWWPEEIFKALLLRGAAQVKLLEAGVQRAGGGGRSSEMRIYLQGLDQGLLTRVWVLKAVLVPVGAGKIRGECMEWLHSHPRSQRNPETLGGNCRPSAEAWQRAQPCSQQRMGGGTSLPSCKERDDLNHSLKKYRW